MTTHRGKTCLFQSMNLNKPPLWILDYVSYYIWNILHNTIPPSVSQENMIFFLILLLLKVSKKVWKIKLCFLLLHFQDYNWYHKKACLFIFTMELHL